MVRRVSHVQFAIDVDEDDDHGKNRVFRSVCGDRCGKCVKEGL